MPLPAASWWSGKKTCALLPSPFPLIHEKGLILQKVVDLVSEHLQKVVK
jgi:hypothetical protein